MNRTAHTLKLLTSPGQVMPSVIEWFVERGPSAIAADLGTPIPTGILRLCVEWSRNHPWNPITDDGIAPIVLNAWEKALYDRTMEEKRAAAAVRAASAGAVPVSPAVEAGGRAGEAGERPAHRSGHQPCRRP